MYKHKLQGNLILLATAVIWGLAFVAQSKGMDRLGPLTYGAARTLLGGFALIPVAYLTGRRQTPPPGVTPAQYRKNTVLGGVVCGLAYFCAATLQQYGLVVTAPGKSGFITALYIVIVPLFGIFLHRKIAWLTWLCVAVATGGFFLLCVGDGFSIAVGDLLTLGCAVCFSLHILSIDYFVSRGVNGVAVSSIQFLVAGSITLVGMFLFETPVWADIQASWVTVLYGGIMSCGVAYTLQIVGQSRTDPTSASLIMSLESVFSAFFGWLILGDTFAPREWLGCVLVFFAVIFSQVTPADFARLFKRNRT